MNLQINGQSLLHTSKRTKKNYENLHCGKGEM